MRPLATPMPACALVLKPPLPLSSLPPAAVVDDELAVVVAVAVVDVDPGVVEVAVEDWAADGMGVHDTGATAEKISLVGEPLQPASPQHCHSFALKSHWIQVSVSSAEQEA